MQCMGKADSLNTEGDDAVSQRAGRRRAAAMPGQSACWSVLNTPNAAVLPGGCRGHGQAPRWHWYRPICDQVHQELRRQPRYASRGTQ